MKKAQVASNKNNLKSLTHTANKIADGTGNNVNLVNQKPGSMNTAHYACGGTGTKDDWITTLQPVPELATHIHISEKLPVNAFGFCVPMMPKQYFSLPWLNNSTKEKCSVRPKKHYSSKNMKNIKFSPVSECPSTQKVAKKTQGIKAASQKLTHTVNGHINGITTHQHKQNAAT